MIEQKNRSEYDSKLHRIEGCVTIILGSMYPAVGVLGKKIFTSQINQLKKSNRIKRLIETTPKKAIMNIQ